MLVKTLELPDPTLMQKPTLKPLHKFSMIGLMNINILLCAVLLTSLDLMGKLFQKITVSYQKKDWNWIIFLSVRKPIGHFTQVVQDNSIEIGCGLIKWKQLKGTKLENVAYFVCNYAMGNMADQPIYVPGATASQCQTGNNPNYTGLCSLEEVVSTTVLSQ